MHLNRVILLLLIICPVFAIGQSNSPFFKQADGFFKSHVFDGRVAYATIKNDRKVLDELLAKMAAADVNAMSKTEKKAFYINAYNIVVIANIVDHYPIKSPMEVTGFFDRLKHNIGGEEVTADHIENTILRPTYGDARFHFVLVCGAVDCPPLVDFAYKPTDELEDQMEKQAWRAINDPNFIRVDDANKSVQLSEIFKWYEGDFKKTHDSNIHYINSRKDNTIPADYKVSYYNYDWSLNDLGAKNGNGNVAPTPGDDEFNLQTFTAGSLLKLGQMDITLFNSMYTQTEGNWQGTDFSGFRETLGGSLLQYTIGVSKNARVNAGFDVNIRYTARSTDSTFSSFTAPFEFSNTDSTRFGVSSFGPRIKFSPFKSVKNFSIQSTFLIPTAEHPEGFYEGETPEENRYWLDWDRLTWWNQFFFDKMVANDKVQLFFEGDLLFRLKKVRQQVNQLSLPVTSIVSYFPNKKITIYGLAQHTPTFVLNPALPEIDDWPIGASNTAVGLGFKYQPNSNLNIELLHTQFVQALNGGLGRTFSLGIKYIR